MPGPLRPALRLLLRRHRAFDRRAARQRRPATSPTGASPTSGSSATGAATPRSSTRRSTSSASRSASRATTSCSSASWCATSARTSAIEAAAEAGRRIKVVGTGPELERLRERYGGQAEFLGRVDDRALARLYAEAAALVVPNVEEFGIAAVEAQAAGRPVVGINAGGARETVVHGRTGLLVPDGDPARWRARCGGLHPLRPAGHPRARPPLLARGLPDAAPRGRGERLGAAVPGPYAVSHAGASARAVAQEHPANP